MPQRYLIVGGGVAGVAAAEAIIRQDPAADLLIIGDDPANFYSRPGLAYYLTGELTEDQLALPQANSFPHLTTRVTALHPQAHQLNLANGQILTYDRLLLATGSTAIRPVMPGIELTGVVTLDNLADIQQMLKLAQRAKRAVVTGGGITALEIVEGLRARGLKTTYLLRSDRYWRNVLDPTESAIVEARLREEGVDLRHRTELVEVIGQNGRVVGVKLKDGQSLPCELLAAAIGVKPRQELARAAGLKTERGILVNEYLQTSDPDIFAAGDVAQVFDPLSGTSVLDTLWPTARAQGDAAGLNMAGARQPYYKEVPLNVTRLAGLTTAIMGTVGQGEDEDVLDIVRGDSETWRQMPDSIAAQTQFEINRLRVMVGQRTLIGAIVMGDQTLSRPLYHLIARQADITPIRAQLLQPEVHLADLLADFWTTWRNEHGPIS